jgi:hypothetical protein
MNIEKEYRGDIFEEKTAGTDNEDKLVEDPVNIIESVLKYPNEFFLQVPHGLNYVQPLEKESNSVQSVDSVENDSTGEESFILGLM